MKSLQPNWFNGGDTIVLDLSSFAVPRKSIVHSLSSAWYMEEGTTSAGSEGWRPADLDLVTGEGRGDQGLNSDRSEITTNYLRIVINAEKSNQEFESLTLQTASFSMLPWELETAIAS